MSQQMQSFRGNGQVAQAATPGDLTAFLKKMNQQIAVALPKHLNADRMTRLAVTAFSQNSALRNCDFHSIAGSIIVASQMGLEIGVAGQGYLVPYKSKCTFVPGWQGIVDLVNRSGRATVWTGAVRDGDQFDYALGDRPFISHKPGDADEGDWTNITHVYAVGRVNGAEWPVIEVWSMKKVLKHRDKTNKVGTRHYSFEHPEMYARKVPLLQVVKYMPKSIELSNAIDADARHERGQAPAMDGTWVDVSAEDEKTRQQPVAARKAPAPGDGDGDGEKRILALRQQINEARSIAQLGDIESRMSKDDVIALQHDLSHKAAILHELEEEAGAIE